MPKKILIVDDEPDVRMSVSQILGVSGYTVIEAESGAECITKLQEGIPDLVVLDIMMPGMSGWDVAAKLKENPQWNTIPIIFLTAKGDEMSVGMGGLASVDYVVKPFDIIDLKDRIEKIIGK